MTDNPQPFRLATTKDGGWYWRLVAANGETLAHSQTYTTRAKAVEGIASAIVNTVSAVDALDGTDDGHPPTGLKSIAAAVTIFEGEDR